MKESHRIVFPTSLRNFTSDELLIELARRESYNGEGGVLFHRVRLITDKGKESEVAFFHGGMVTRHNGRITRCHFEVLIDGDWRSQDWIKDNSTAPVAIHKGEYD